MTKVLMNDTEAEHVAARAMARGVSVPRALIEAVIVEKTYTIGHRQAFFREFMLLKRHMRRVSDEANRIARVLNSGGDVNGREIRMMLARAEAVAAAIEGLPEVR